MNMYIMIESLIQKDAYFEIAILRTHQSFFFVLKRTERAH